MRKLAVLFTAELYSHVTSLLRKESVMVVAWISLLNTVLSRLKGICNLFTGTILDCWLSLFTAVESVLVPRPSNGL